MRKLVVCMLLLVCCLLGEDCYAEDPKDIAGYGKSVWGMSVEEVLIAEGDRIKRSDQPGKDKESTTGLSIENIEIGSNRFRAIFLFSDRDQKLAKVRLSGLERNSQFTNARSFSTIEKLLTEKYGPPTFKQENKSVSWKFTKTSIELSHLIIPGLLTQVVIIYKSASASMEEFKNL